MEYFKNNVSRAISGCKNAVVLFMLVFGTTDCIYAQQWSGARPDGHAPIGVMGDHTHHAGGFMFTYRYMLMNMDGMRIGTNGVSSQRVLEDFMVTPTDMDMQMHMFGGMWAPTDFFTAG